jgi:hypothetical protein
LLQAPNLDAFLDERLTDGECGQIARNSLMVIAAV